MASLHDRLQTVLGDRADLIAIALEVHAAGAAAWPGVTVRAEALATRVAARAAATAEPGDAGDRCDADLYLATALADSDPAALAAFESRLIPHIDAALGRMRLPATACDEVRQELRVELLVAEPGSPPRIDGYLGLGALSSWLRVSATRRGLRVLRATAREETLDEIVLAGWPDDGADPAQRHLQREYAGHLKAALVEALATLTVRERNLLRQSALDDLGVDALAAIYRVHRSTCARWLVDARAALARATRRALGDRLGPREGQLDSVLRYLESDVELSLSRLLREPSAI